MKYYAVTDLEMCKIPKAHRKRCGLSNEIIQIGAVLLNDSFEIVDSFKTLVSPRFGTVDSYIYNLTGIRQSDTVGAPSFEAAIKLFADWLPEDTTLITWSDSDEVQLTKEMRVKGIEIAEFEEILDSYIDCQELFGDKMDSIRQYSLSEALFITGIDYKNGAHDALVDAHNTALLFAKIQLEPELILSSYFSFEDEVEDFSYTPFADLLKSCAKAG